MKPIQVCSWLSLLIAGLCTTACTHKVSDNPIETIKKNVVSNYTQIVYATYSDALSQAILLQSAIQVFLDSTTQENFDYCKDTWKRARLPYDQTEAFRFYNGPIDAGETGVEELLNAWPLDEVYLDYIDGNTNSGIINNTDLYPSITAQLLTSLNENGGENNISTGYHAIEFLLWGQDFNDNGPGKRPYADYLPQTAHADRRAQYISICADLIVDELTYLKNQWNINQKGSYAETFLQLPVNEAISKIVTGIATLSKQEMAGERMFTAYDNKSQEDEQSCFSDFSRNDLIANQKGIFNVYSGKYVSQNGLEVHGASLSDLMNTINVAQNSELLQTMSDAEEQLNTIYDPFDQALVLENKRPDVLRAIKTLQKEGDLLTQLAASVGVAVTLKTDIK